MDARRAANNSSGIDVPLNLISLAHLLPTYGHTRGSAILKYLADFAPYVPNFQPIVGGVREQHTAGLAGQVLLYLTCPLLVQCRDGLKTVLVVNILFPQQFPDRAPFSILVVPSNAKVKEGHALVTHNGIIRLSNLPLLQNGPLPPYSLCEILLAITDGLEECYPFEFANPTASTSGGPAASSSSPYYTGSTSSSNGSSGPAVAQQATNPQPQRQVVVPVASPAPPPPRAEVVQAAEALMVHLGDTSCAEYLAMRDEGLQLLLALEADKTKLQAALQDVQARLQKTKQLSTDLENLKQLVDDPATVIPRNSEALLQPMNEESANALSFLANIHALDDAMSLEEVLLKKSVISAEEYVRSISELARTQFLSRYRYNRLLNTHEVDSNQHATPSPLTVLPAPQAKVAAPPDNTKSPTSTTAAAAASPLSVQPAAQQSPVIATVSGNPVDILCSEFKALDRGLIADVWEATKSLAVARTELTAIAG